MHGAQRPKMLSSLFCVDVQPHHDVKVQCQQFPRSKTSSDDNHMLSQPESVGGTSVIPRSHKRLGPHQFPVSVDLGDSIIGSHFADVKKHHQVRLWVKIKARHGCVQIAMLD